MINIKMYNMNLINLNIFQKKMKKKTLIWKLFYKIKIMYLKFLINMIAYEHHW